MSHFSVFVRLPATTKVVDFEKEIGKLMLTRTLWTTSTGTGSPSSSTSRQSGSKPYKESGAGANDPPELKALLEWEDNEEEYLNKYNTDCASMVRLADGKEVSLFERDSTGQELFRNPKIFGEPRYILPPGAVEFDKPVKELFTTFEQYMEEYCGYKARDKKKKRYGYWHNPNKKWDWWTIGGRWTGKLLIGYDPAEDKDNYKKCWMCNNTGTRPDANYPQDCEHQCRAASPAGYPVIGKGCNACAGTGWEFDSFHLKPVGNFLRISQLSWDEIHKETVKKLDEFWEEWQQLCDGKEFPPFDGPRDMALSLGLLDCKDNSELDGKEWKVRYWDDKDTPEDKKRNRCDVLKHTTKEWLLQNCYDAFTPISTWVRLDETGWKEKGEMGWWGANDATPESTRAHANGLTEWLKNGNQEDWIIVCDCHI